MWGTFYGGTNNDLGYGIGVDNDGDIYVIGRTFSNDFDTKNALLSEGVLEGNSDAVIMKFSNLGEDIFATYYGGELDEKGVDLDFDSDNSVYFTGISNSKLFNNSVVPFNNYYSDGNHRFDVANDAFIVMLDDYLNLNGQLYLEVKGMI
ncbi:MAG: hypothetical protein HC803_02480 [Saprospiraceae bacterium]|nr:hypothetical protein [Saprospiraceae bacterium]